MGSDDDLQVGLNGRKGVLNSLQSSASHGAGFCSVAWCQIDDDEGPRAAWHAISAGQDGKLVLRQGDESLAVVKISGDHEKPSNCVTVTLDGKMVASVQGDYVQLYCTPDLDLVSSACRFHLPARAAAVGGKGAGTLAAAGDDGNIKLVSVKDGKMLRQVITKSHVRSVALDDGAGIGGTYVAASFADGALGIWDAESGAQEYKKHVCPKVDPESSRRSQVAFSPDGGSLLAAPGTDNDVMLLERLNWKPITYLSGAHQAQVNTLAFSPNGVYIATGGLDKQVVVWLAERGVAVAKTTLEEVPSTLAWHPRGNALLVAGEGGGVGLWEGAVPAGATLPSPWRSQDDVLRHADAAAAAGVSTAAGTTLDDGPEESLAGGAASRGTGGRLAARGKRRGDGGGGGGAGAGASDLEDDIDDIMDDAEDEDGLGRAKRRRRAGAGGGVLRPGAAAAALMAAPAPRLPKAQAPVQPGATPDGRVGGSGGEGRFLAYNGVGCVISRKVDSHRTCEVVFHDASRGRAKLPLLTDLFGFHLASLGEGGVVYGSTSTADAPSTIMHRPFDSWSANSDWMVQLAADEAPACLAAGKSFIAAATTAQLLRIYSPSGRQLAALSLPGAPVCLAASGHLLLSVHLAANPCWEAPAQGSQRLQYQLLDVARQALLASGRLPLSRAAGLAWLGFSEEGLPAAWDSAGVMRVRTPDWGGAWAPVFDSKLARSEGGSEVFWPVSLSCRELTCIVTSEQAPHPAVHPRPMLSVQPLQVPPAAAEGAPSALEDQGMRLAIRMAQLRAAAADTEDPEEAARCSEELQQALLEGDRLALRQFNEALSCHRESRALELVGTLNDTRSIAGALKLANARRQAALAERISAFLEERLEWEEAQAAAEEEAQQVQQVQQQQQQRRQGLVGGEEEEDEGVAVGGGELRKGSPRDDAGAKAARPPAADQLRAPPAGGAAAGAKQPGAGKNPFARPSGGSGGCGGSSGGSGSSAAGKKPTVADVGAAAGGSRPAAGGNPFARVKKVK